MALAAGGCGRPAEVPDDRMLRALSEETNGVVAIATTLEANASHVTLCSGALVAPNLVLTARHCVSRAVTATPSCDAAGARTTATTSPTTPIRRTSPSTSARRCAPIKISPGRTPAARSTRRGKVLCDADVAFIVLDRAITNVTVLPIRLHSAVEPGDVVVPIGFGGGPANAVGVRVARDRSLVLATGPAANSETGAVLGPREFEVDSATCRGDSGGPAIDMRSGEIVGVVSRGGSCSAPGNHVYTRVDAYAKLAGAAFAAAERAAAESLAVK